MAEYRIRFAYTGRDSVDITAENEEAAFEFFKKYVLQTLTVKPMAATVTTIDMKVSE